MSILRFALVCSLAAAPALRAQTRPAPAPRPGLSAGMGVEYVSFPDVTGLINATTPADRVAQFKSAAEFFGSFSFPLEDIWALKIEYAYDIASYSSAGVYVPTSFALNLHMPSLILQYVLVERGVYNVKVGAGGGYHFGSMTEKYQSLDNTFSGSGPGAVIDLEANTAFGDHLYAYLGANIRWEFIGKLSDPQGVSPGLSSAGTAVTLHSFGAGVRLGACYLF